MKVTELLRMLRDDGFYWVAGATQFACGSTGSSVFVIDTDSGAEQKAVYWGCGEFWLTEAAEVAQELGMATEAMFPYAWSYDVHGGQPTNSLQQTSAGGAGS